MKRNIIKITSLLLSLSLLTACSQSRFMDLGGFVYNFNRVSDNEIAFEDVYVYNDEHDEIFEIFIGDKIVLKLVCENSRIKQIRIAMAKVDSKGEAISVDNEAVISFLDTTENTIRAFCNFDKEKAVALMNEFLLYEKTTFGKQGELYKKDDKFSFVYYSDSMVCTFMISDTYLVKEENTEKPISKPAYGNTTNVRGETEPLPSFKNIS